MFSHFKNTSDPKDVTVSGMMISEIALPQNALCPIVVIVLPSANVTVLFLKLILNAHSPNSLTPA